MSNLKFFWNGIKGSDGQLQKCSYSEGRLNRHPEGTLTIYAKHYRRFSAEVGEAFTITNDTDTQSDYFADDTIRVLPGNPLYAKVQAAVAASKAHYEKSYTKRTARLAMASGGAA